VNLRQHKNMALTQTQIDQLNAAYNRTGGQTATDKANIDYAMKTYGWKPTAQTAPTATPTTQTATSGLTQQQINELNIAAQRQASGSASQTDIANLNYATKTYGYQAPSSLSASAIQPTTSVKTVEQPKSNLDSIVGNLTAPNSLANILNMKPESEEYKTAQEKQSAIMSKLEEYLEKGYSQAERFKEMSAEFGLPEQQKQLADLNVKIAQLASAFDSRMVDEQGKPILSAIIGGRVGQLQRQKAVELGGLSAVAQAMQGNISAAQSTIKDTIEMEYGDQLNRIEALKTQLEMNRDVMSAEEKKLADKQNVLLNERERMLNQEKQEKEGIYNVMMAAAQSGADTATLEKIMGSGSVGEAIMNSGNFLSERTGLSITDQMRLMEGGYTMGADGSIQVDVSSATAEQIANAIKQIESGGNYKAKGASGEYGAYQFMPATWLSWSKEYQKSIGQTGFSLAQTPENQDKVAMFKIQQWLNQGLTPQQIAAKWNSGSEVGWENKIGVNKQGVAYNVPQYVNKFTTTLGGQLKASIPSGIAETMGFNENQAALLSSLGLAQDQIANVGGIMNGTRPPLTSTEMRTVGGQKVAAGLSALGYNLTKAQADWTAMTKRLGSMNSVSQLRLFQAADALEGSIGQAERIYNEWLQVGKTSGVSSFNRASLVASANLPGQAGVAARTLLSHIEDMNAELATIYRGGNTPTDMALEQAAKSLSADWNQEQFFRNLALIRENLQIRKNSMNASGMIPGNIYSETVAGGLQTQGTQSPAVDYATSYLQQLGQQPKQSFWTTATSFIKNLFK